MPAPPFLSAEVLLKERRVESHRIEFKASWDDYTRPRIVRTICAFANDLLNQNGGYVIVGVEAPDGVAVLPPKGLPSESVERVMKELQGDVAAGIRPQYVPQVYADEVDGRHVLVAYCPPGHNGPFTAPEQSKKDAPFIPWVRLGGETKKAVGELRRQLDEAVRRTPFDAQPCWNLTVPDLVAELVESFLRRANSRLAGQNISLDEKLRALGVLQRTNGHEVPLNAGVLFFTVDPHKHFRGAEIEVVQFGDDGDMLHEQTFHGSLPALIEQVLTHLEGEISTRVRKYSDRAEADRDPAWPFAAVEEALVNAVQHRGYDPENPDPIKVHVHPDRMVITSYPGPMPGLTREHFERGNVVDARARNRYVGVLLKDIRLAEAHGSGIMKIHQEMAKAGNPPPRFDFDEPQRTRFEVTLPIHPAHLPQARALPLRMGVPSPASELVGREALIERVNRLLEHRNVCLLGPPGRGVSSTLNGLEAAGGHHHRLDMRGVDAKALRQYVKELVTENERPIVLLDHLRGESSVIPAILESNPDLRIVAAPARVIREQSWWAHFDAVVIPPLDSADAQSLALRLLAGLGMIGVEALALAIAKASAGLPHLVHRLVHGVYVDRTWRDANRIPELLLELVGSIGDPTHMRARVETFGEIDWDDYDRVVLARVYRSPNGCSLDDLILELVSHNATLATARHVVQEFLAGGWLVERDGRIDFEHPLLREQWERLDRPPFDQGSGLEDDEDVPF